MIGQNHPTARGDFPGIRSGDLPEIDDSCSGRIDGFDASRVGFDLTQAFRADHFQARDAIGKATLVQLLQPGQLLFMSRDDNFTT